jgi:hypothetical protein
MIIVRNNFLFGYIGCGDWENYFKAHYDMLNNKCHSLSRNECYDDYTDEKYRAEGYWQRTTRDAHLYYNSVKCASDVMSSCLSKISIFTVIFALLMLF